MGILARRTIVHGVNKRAWEAGRVVSVRVSSESISESSTPARATFSGHVRARSALPHDVRVRVANAPAGCTWYAQGWRTVFVQSRRVRERGGDGYSYSESG